ncbi:MAG: ABC transporter ATP-binding protein [Candidatus Hydrothermarchaeales archaeon]
MNILEVRDLKTYFFTRRGIVKAVDGITFDLKKGEVLCLVGESGSGKTVSALSILGLVDQPGRIIEGEVLLDGENMREYSKEKLRRIRGKRIAMVFQDPFESLNPVFTIGDQITEPMRLHLGLSDAEAKDKARDLMERVGISSAEEKLKSYPHEFSGGMNQRAMIAMALSCDPYILIADEPTSALDVTTQSQFLELLMGLKKERETSMIFITHDMGIVAEIADRIVVMYAGKVMERGTVWQIFDNPRHPYTIGLMNCLPDVMGYSGKKLTPIPGVIPSLVNPPTGCVFHPRCSFAKDICSSDAPQEAKVQEGHFSACHFWDSRGVVKASEDVRVGK